LVNTSLIDDVAVSFLNYKFFFSFDVYTKTLSH